MPNTISNRIKISKSFHLDEFIPPAIYKLYGASSTWFVRPEIVKLAQFIRDHFGKSMVVNNWATSGPYSERGYRIPDSLTGSKYSQHRLANAIDFTISGISPAEINRAILVNQKTFMDQGLTTIEHIDNTPTWCHVDARQTKMDKILVVRPAAVSLMDSDGFNPAQSDYFIWEGELIPISFPLNDGN